MTVIVSLALCIAVLLMAGHNFRTHWVYATAFVLALIATVVVLAAALGVRL